MRLRRLLLPAAFLGLVFSAGCSTPPPGQTGVHDPYERLNRYTYRGNRFSDRVLIRPVSYGYAWAVPGPIRSSVKNFSSNLDMPRVVANDLLQADIGDGAHNTFRFGFNSVFGIAGLFDPATRVGLEKRDTGFDDTLARWGARQGAYLVVPIIGPSSERAAVGIAGDIVMNPLRLIDDSRLTIVQASTSILYGLDQRNEFGEFIDRAYYESEDGYLQVRSLYAASQAFRENAASRRESDEEYEAIVDSIED